ncbi:MAG: hypothetical protein ACOZAN_02920 [Patescibacteria group bacterium]
MSGTTGELSFRYPSWTNEQYHDPLRSGAENAPKFADAVLRKIAQNYFFSLHVSYSCKTFEGTPQLSNNSREKLFKIKFVQVSKEGISTNIFFKCEETHTDGIASYAGQIYEGDEGVRTATNRYLVLIPKYGYLAIYS